MIGDMFVQGVSQARVGVILETLNGVKPSPSTVSRVFHTLEEEYQQWKTRMLPEHYSYVFADGTFFSVIYDDEGQKTPVLGLFGITPEGKREVIAMMIGQSESRDAWGNLLDDIKSRGVKQVDLWITDGNQTMIDAINQRYPDSLRQRCVKHKMQNILAHVPDKQADSVGQEFMAIFYQKNREKADLQATAFREKHRAAYPEAIACMNRDWEACLTFYRFPEHHWSRVAHPHNQRHRETIPGDQEAFKEDGRAVPKRRQLYAAGLRGNARAQISKCPNVSGDRPSAFTHYLTNDRLAPELQHHHTKPNPMGIHLRATGFQGDNFG